MEQYTESPEENPNAPQQVIVCAPSDVKLVASVNAGYPVRALRTCPPGTIHLLPEDRYDELLQASQDLLKGEA